MTDAALLAHAEDAGLLERSINYTLGCLHLVTPDMLTRPTPCARWDLRALLWHLHDSLWTLHEAIDVGDVGDVGPRSASDACRGPVTAVRDAARTLLGAWADDDGMSTVSVAGHPVAAGLVTGAGAIEVAVHGWDVAVACGYDRLIPARLAERLLPLSSLVIDDADRPDLFAATIPAPRAAPPGDQLVSFLGRAPVVR